MDRSDRVVTDTYQNRNLFMNIPSGSGRGIGGYPSSNFANDVYSMWNYTNLFGSWNHGSFQAPGAWTDAAHKNGTDILSGIQFFTPASWNQGGSDGSGYAAMLAMKNQDGTYKYVNAMLNCLMYFGFDGINYNWETNTYTYPDVKGFHQALYKKAKEIGFDSFHAAIYTLNSSLTTYNVGSLLGDKTNGRIFDVMLNYSSGDFDSGIASSAKVAKDAMGTADGVYQSAWIVKMDRAWSILNGEKRTFNWDTYEYDVTQDPNAKEMGICLWGEHADSRFWSYNSGSDAVNAQSNYQRLLERGFSGGRRNPLNRPAVTDGGHNWEGENALVTFPGLATWIPERSTIEQPLPFATHFNLGNGERYNYKGKKTAGTWYNMANQDVVPTYRWLVVEPGTLTYATNITPAFTHVDSYMGGSCLQLTGQPTASGTDVVLYQTKLTVGSTNPIAKLAVKTKAAGQTGLELALRVGGIWKTYAVPETKGTEWEEKTISLSDLSTGNIIERIALRVKGSTPDYNVLVGKLELNDDVKVTPANVKDLKFEVKEESQKSFSAKLYWDVDHVGGERLQYGMVFNHEAHIDHFEILYKNGKDGKVFEVGRTTQWGTYVPNIVSPLGDQPFLGVVAVSTDLKNYSPIQWVEIKRADASVLPEETAGGTDTYGVSKINANADGYKTAIEQRFLTSVVTKGASFRDINYSNTQSPRDSTQYQNARDHKLIVAPGDNITMTFKAYNNKRKDGILSNDGLRYCFGGGWLDLDGSGTFNHPDPVPGGRKPGESSQTTDPLGERIFFVGNLRASSNEIESDNGYTFTFQIPADACIGKSRLRIVFSDAWFAGTFLPTGLTAKGFTIDFDVEIQGTPADNMRQFVDTQHDKGEAEESAAQIYNEKVNTGVENTVFAKDASVVVNADNMVFTNVDKAWLYTIDGKLVSFLQKPTTVSRATIKNGVYVLKLQSGSMIRTEKLVVR
ncbi:MAG: endo-beta-N-acetylglucosaminidase [Prevotellaceae bacterium]|nr:endo-beta-N-acetylglucosaminidase [Prevotellaceae bacterium]